MKRIVSTTLAVLSLGAICYVDRLIAIQYKQADGKTQGLFGLVELSYSYKYLIVIPAVLSLLIVFMTAKSGNHNRWDWTTTFLALLAVMAVLTPSWKLLI